MNADGEQVFESVKICDYVMIKGKRWRAAALLLRARSDNFSPSPPNFISILFFFPPNTRAPRHPRL